MIEPQKTVLVSEEPAQPSLGQRASRGLIWMVGQTLVGKVASVAGQVVIAWFLSPNDFGLVGLAYAIAGFPSLLRDAGLQQILVHRHRRFGLWAGPVFWMSLSLGLLSGALLAVSAPIAEHMLKAPGLTGLILLMAISVPVNALATVPAARMQADLWYRFQSILALATALMMTALNILCAYRGYGAYSFVLPYLLTNAMRTAVLWMVTRESIGWQPHFRRWRYLFGDSGTLLVIAALVMLVGQGDYLMMGFLTSADIVGVFYFAFNLSMQTLAILTTNLGSMLFPALNKLNSDRERQINAFVNASRLFAALAIPFCLLQAALSEPGIHLIFKPRWNPAIPVLEILSVAMLFRTVGLPAMSLAAAQNRLRSNLIFFSANSIIFLSFVAIGAWLGRANAAVTVAGAELLFFSINEPLYVYSLLRMNGRGWRELREIFIFPLAAGGIAAFSGYLALHAVRSEARVAEGLKIAIGTVVASTIYILLLRSFAQELWQELSHRVRSLTK